MKNFKKLILMALQELRGQWNFQIFLILNLAFGLFGFFLLQVFQQSLNTQTQQKAQEILGGDFEISSRRIISDEDIKKFESLISYNKKTWGYSFFAMAINGDFSRLVRVRTFDENFPLYGKLELKKNGQPVNLDRNGKKIWLDPELVSQMKVDSAGQIKLGDTQFDFAGTIEKDPTRSFRAGGFAPVVFISHENLAGTGLIREGSTISHSLLYKLESKTQSLEFQKKLSKATKDISIRFETAEQDADSDNRVLKYFSDYLGLVSLVALGLCFLCGGYLLRWIFLRQRKTIAVYKTLGLQENELALMQVFKNCLLSISALLVAVIAVYIALEPLQQVMTNFKLPIVLTMTGQSVFITSLIAIFVPQLMSFPLSIEILQLSPRDLFQPMSVVKKKSKLFLFWVVGCAFLFWGLTVWQSQSLKIGSLFTGGLILLYGIFKVVLLIMMRLMNIFLEKVSFINSYSFKSLIRKSASTDLVFITMSLSILVLCLLPHVKTSIIEEIRPSDTSQIPSLFLFDIQPDQKDGLESLTKDKVNTSLDLFPMVRSRILKLNNVDFERVSKSDSGFSTREEEEDARFRNRGVNLTYKSKLDLSEKIIAGRWNPEKFSGAPAIAEISLEERFAERIGARIGDVLMFDVQGLEISGKVTSIRQVRWTSFKPNFFIVFQPGVLEEAPQMFLSSVALTNDLAIENYQNSVVKLFSNVSIINVKRTVQDSLVFINQMSIALEGMALMSMVIGLFVFVILLNTQVRERMAEMNLLQILGLSNQKVSQIIRRQFSIIIGLSILSGVGMSFLSVYVVMSVIFDIGTSFDFVAIGNLVLSLIPITALAIWFGLRPLKKLSPNDLIRSS